MALMYLVMSKEREGGRAWNTFEWNTLSRLHRRGWISELRVKEIAVAVTPEGLKKAEELFKEHFQ